MKRCAALLGLFCILSGCADYCETWDGYYCVWGSYYRSAAAPAPVTASGLNRAAALSGDWRLDLEITESDCPAWVAGVSTTAAVQRSGQRVTMAVEKLPLFRGARTPRGFRASSRYRLPLSTCSADLTVKFITRTRDTAAVRAAAALRCSGQPFSSMSAEGSARRR